MTLVTKSGESVHCAYIAFSHDNEQEQDAVECSAAGVPNRFIKIEDIDHIKWYDVDESGAPKSTQG